MKLEIGDVLYCEWLDQILICTGEYDKTNANVYYHHKFESGVAVFLGNEFTVDNPDIPYKISFTISKRALTLISKGDFK